MAATEACDEVRNSQRFAKLLELLLLMGNYLNTGSRNAQSIGFDISFLTKVSNPECYSFIWNVRLFSWQSCRKGRTVSFMIHILLCMQHGHRIGPWLGLMKVL